MTVTGDHPCGFCGSGHHEYCERKNGIIRGAAAKGADWLCPCHAAEHQPVQTVKTKKGRL